uniref:Uncharacterized protein n=1 Tax=Anguilla anguilla TaxID=7936 RepID=A0A0E9VGC0_ANGAN
MSVRLPLLAGFALSAE